MNSVLNDFIQGSKNLVTESASAGKPKSKFDLTVKNRFLFETF